VAKIEGFGFCQQAQSETYGGYSYRMSMEKETTRRNFWARLLPVAGEGFYYVSALRGKKRSAGQSRGGDRR